MLAYAKGVWAHSPWSQALLSLFHFIWQNLLKSNACLCWISFTFVLLVLFPYGVQTALRTFGTSLWQPKARTLALFSGVSGYLLLCGCNIKTYKKSTPFVHFLKKTNNQGWHQRRFLTLPRTLRHRVICIAHFNQYFTVGSLPNTHFRWPEMNILQAIEHYIHHTSWYLFLGTRYKKWGKNYGCTLKVLKLSGLKLFVPICLLHVSTALDQSTVSTMSWFLHWQCSRP